MSSGYEILTLGDLPAYESANHGDSRLIPLRGRLGLRAFGANCWTAEVGKQIVPTHEEDSGHEELYVVVSGRVRFPLGAETFDAPAGTLVHALPGTNREAFAEEPGSVVLAVGATPGQAFEAQGWDDTVAAFGEAAAGNVDQGRTLMQAVTARHPNEWGARYNLACFEARFGDKEAAIEELRVAAARNRKAVLEWLPHDTDLDSLRDDPRFQELLG